MTRPAKIGYENKPDDYRAAGVVYRTATQNDDDILKSILRQNSMESWISLSTEHEPSYFASTDLFGHTEPIVAYKDKDTSSTVGMCSYAKMPVHINGKQVYASYLGDLRVLPAFRNKLSIIRNGFKSVKILSENRGESLYWFTSIATANTAARRLLEANLKGMPVYRPQGKLVTMALLAKSGKHSNMLQRAQFKDVPALVEFYNKRACCYQYSPVLTEDWLLSLNGQNGLCLQDFWILKDGVSIHACFALWDQRKFKQTVVRGYRFPLNIVRRPYNLFANLSGRVVLPAIGEQINYIFIAFLALDEPVTAECKAILDSALALIKTRNSDMAMLGLSTQNPILKELKSYPKQTYYTCIESVTWPDQPDVKQSDLDPDNRTVQPEIAIL